MNKNDVINMAVELCQHNEEETAIQLLADKAREDDLLFSALLQHGSEIVGAMKTAFAEKGSLAA